MKFHLAASTLVLLNSVNAKSFTHPGVLFPGSQLSLIRDKVAASAQPWTLAYADMRSETLASLTRKPRPVPEVACGPFSNPDIGCAQERFDAFAAYNNALAWAVEGKQEFADKAIEYMDAWSEMLKGHTNVNARLQAAWAASIWTRTAEIIRYTQAGWSDASVARFETMMRDIYLPQVAQSGEEGMNWELVLIEAATSIGVFLNDQAVFDSAVNRVKAWTRAFVYLKTDGPTPLPPPFMGNMTTNATLLSEYWGGQTTWEANGITTETCQEIKRVGYGIASISHAAETAFIQGVDLWTGDVGERIAAALSFNIETADAMTVPAWVCNGKGVDTSDLGPVTEVPFHAMSDRLGREMYKAESLTNRQRPAGANYLVVGWETLTSAGEPAA